MTTVTHSHHVFIRAPHQMVFEYVSDLTRHPEWNGGLKIEALTPGPIAVGKEYASQGVVAMQKDRPNTVRVSEYDHPHSYGFVAHDPNFGEVTHIFKFTEQTGGTYITRSMTVDVNPVIAFFFRFLVYPLIGSPSMERSFAALKDRLEN